MKPRPRLLTFGVFELDTTTGELRKEGRLIHLRHQPVGVLRMLLDRAGELVTRREITEALWPEDIDVDVEQGLNHCMKEIRAALGDRPESPRFIQTLPRRGYRFLVDVHDGRDSSLLPMEAVEKALPPPAPLPASPEDRGAGLKVRVTVARPSDNAVLWSETYDRPVNESQALENDVVAGIRTGLRQVLAVHSRPPDPEEKEPSLRDGRFE